MNLRGVGRLFGWVMGREKGINSAILLMVVFWLVFFLPLLPLSSSNSAITKCIVLSLISGLSPIIPSMISSVFKGHDRKMWGSLFLFIFHIFTIPAYIHISKIRKSP